MDNTAWTIIGLILLMLVGISYGAYNNSIHRREIVCTINHEISFTERGLAVAYMEGPTLFFAVDRRHAESVYRMKEGETCKITKYLPGNQQ